VEPGREPLQDRAHHRALPRDAQHRPGAGGLRAAGCGLRAAGCRLLAAGCWQPCEACRAAAMSSAAPPALHATTRHPPPALHTTTRHPPTVAQILDSRCRPLWSSELTCPGGAILAANEQCGGTTRYKTYPPTPGPYKGTCCPEGTTCTKLDDKKWTCKAPIPVRAASEWRLRCRAGRPSCWPAQPMGVCPGAAVAEQGRAWLAWQQPAAASPALNTVASAPQVPAAPTRSPCRSTTPAAARTCAAATTAAHAALLAQPASAYPSSTGSARATDDGLTPAFKN
jgi:hypothetical protein